MGPMWRFVLTALLGALVATPTQAAWHEARSNHFIIYSDQSPGELKRFAEQLERFDQAVRHVRGMEDPALSDANRLRIYALKSESAIARLAGSRMVRGFYHARASGAVAFVPRNSGSKFVDWDLDTQAIFFHEYAHHLQLRTASVAMPAWVTEGFAEFFATAEVRKDGSVAIGLPPQYRAYTLFNTAGLKLDQMLGATYRKLTDGQVDELYGKGWLLIHYMNFKPERRGQMAKYLEAIHNGKSPIDAARIAFGDLRALEKELERYKRGKIPGLVVQADQLKVGPIAIRPLGPGEAAVMDVHIRSTRGVDKQTAPAVAVDARKAAAAFPNDPFAQSVLAEAEHDAGDYVAAEAAADRALAANPNHFRALIYKGRAQLRLAAKSPDKADWKAVRSWFSRANKLDTENAEPLMLFYLAYAGQGVEPTKNAIEALLYAQSLAPQDDELRGMAVQQLLIADRAAEAKQVLAPLAYQPHLPDAWRDWYGQVMVAISAGDSKGALKLMEKGPSEQAVTASQQP